MTGHTPERAAEITAAATAAGAIDPSDMLVLIDPAKMVNATDAVAKMKAIKPHLFKPSVPEMTGPEYAAAKREKLREAERQRRDNELAAMNARISRKHSK